MLRSVTPLFLILTLSGCVRYEDGIQVAKDGSGTAGIIFSRPDTPAAPGTAQAALASMFDARLSADAMKKGLPEGVTCDYETVKEGGHVATCVRYKFDNVNKFIAWAAGSNSPFSNVSITWRGRSLEYSRTFRPLEPEELAIVRANLADGEFVFRFSGPGTLGQTDAERYFNDAIWTFRAPELLRGRTIKAQYSTGLPWPLYLLAIAALGLLAGFLTRRWRKKKLTALVPRSKP